MAAPTARPVKPASEIGVSMMRSLPNSSTRPLTTLNGARFRDILTEQHNVGIATHRDAASRIASPKEISRMAPAPGPKDPAYWL